MEFNGTVNLRGTVNFWRISTYNLRCIRKMHQECRPYTAALRFRTKTGCKHGSSPCPRIFRLKLCELKSLAGTYLKSKGRLRRFSRNTQRLGTSPLWRRQPHFTIFLSEIQGGGSLLPFPKWPIRGVNKRTTLLHQLNPGLVRRGVPFRPTRLPQNPAGGGVEPEDAPCVQSPHAASSVKCHNSHLGRTSPRRHPTPKIHFYHPRLRPWPSLLTGRSGRG